MLRNLSDASSVVSHASVGQQNIPKFSFFQTGKMLTAGKIKVLRNVSLENIGLSDLPDRKGETNSNHVLEVKSIFSTAQHYGEISNQLEIF